MSTRASVLGATALAALGTGLVLTPALGQQVVHRHGFAGRQPALVRGEANVRVVEKEHDVSTQSFKSQPSSEHIQLVSEAGTGDAAFVYYYYETPPAPVTEALSAGVWVKATRPGVQLRARVVFPKEPDPARPETPLTILVVGRTSEKVRAWDHLTIDDVPQLIGKALPPVRTKLGHDVNTADAYVDRLVLNLYTGPGPVDVCVDDLDIGPVRPPARPDPAAAGIQAVPTRQPKGAEPAGGQGRQVAQRGGQLMVDDKAFFFRAIRHTGTPLHVLRAAGLNTLWLPPDATPDVIEEAGREGWLVIPSAPPLDLTAVGTAPGQAVFDAFRRKFGASDVLFWDLGGGLTDEQRLRVQGAAAEVRKGDRRRPIGGDLWDGFEGYSASLDVVGAHRWPLFTSLELPRYRDWLRQRKELAGSRPVFWTWVQNHLPDWYAASIAARPVEPGSAAPDLAFTDPVGPHPEQVRQLAYISLASGCQGLGFWSDRYLADSHQGRDRLQGMALLNTELDLLTPVLLTAQASGNRADWRGTSHPNVHAALISGQRGIILLPIWIGRGDQYVPPQGAVAGLQVTIPTVAEGYDPWLITPAGAQRIQAVRGPGGTTVTLNEFDMVAPIVFTNDLKLVVWWQDHARRYGRLAARCALDLAAAEYEKVRVVHLKLAGMGVQVRGADRLLEDTHRYYNEAQKHFAAELYDKAYQDATRALRPLRVLMRDHWALATEGLDVPTASPFAVSYFSLPQHWELAREVQAGRPGPSVLPDGGFEPAGEIPEDGIRVDRIPGWSARAGSIETDRVVVAAGVVRADKLVDGLVPRPAPKLPKTIFEPSRRAPAPDADYVPPAPQLGKGVLKLEVSMKPLPGRDGKPAPRPKSLERTFLAVDSPPVRLPPGTLVRVSAWVKVPRTVAGTADGALFYDDAGGEPLAVRVLDTTDPRAFRAPPEEKDPKKLQEALGKLNEGIWKQYHLYRRVPASGQISVTMALTGLGVAYFDDVRIEPLAAGAAAASARPGFAPRGTPGGSGNRPPVVPAGYRPQ